MQRPRAVLVMQQWLAAKVALVFLLPIILFISVPCIIIAAIVAVIKKFGIRFLDWPEPKPISRGEVADLLDEFAGMNWQYSDDFDLAFSEKFEDPVMQSIAIEFLKIQKDYEENCQVYQGKIPEKSLVRLREMAAQLRLPQVISEDGSASNE